MRSLRAKRANTLVLKMRRPTPVRSPYYSTTHYSFKVLSLLRVASRLYRISRPNARFARAELSDSQGVSVGTPLVIPIESVAPRTQPAHDLLLPTAQFSLINFETHMGARNPQRRSS